MPLSKFSLEGIADYFGVRNSWQHFVAGGTAGFLSKTLTAPMDRLKVQVMVHVGRNQTSMSNMMRYMIKEGGVKGLWRGNGINIIKTAPEKAIYVGAFNQMKKVISGDSKTELKIHERIMAGSCAGASAQTVIYPLEVLKTRLALRKTGETKGIIKFSRKMFVAEGWKAFYKGYWPNLFGIVPHAGIELAVYETANNHIIEKYKVKDTNPGAMLTVGCGIFSSSCGQLATYPLVVVRTKLQSQAGLGSNLLLPKEQTHALSLFRYILRTEGVPGLYRGLLPNFCKVAPSSGIFFYVYERVRNRLGATMS